MTANIRILLADDHTVLRQGMAQAISFQPDMEVVAQAANGREAMALAESHQPDVILLDINMPELDGIATTRHLAQTLPKIGIIILTMYRRDDYIIEAIKAGASGYLLKEVELEELLAAIRAVARGEAVIDPTLAARVFAELRQPQPEPPPPATDLSPRDIEILRLLAEGLSNQEIANQLALSEKTVRNRLSLIFRQLQLENRTQAALYALREGLVDPEKGQMSRDA